MSIKALNGALAHDGLTTPQFAVLFLLANHADAAGQCFPSYPYLMRKTGLSRSGAHKALAELEAMGLVVRLQPKSTVGKSLRATFHLPFGVEDEAAAEGSTTWTGPPDGPLGVHEVDGRGPPDGPLKKEEPSKEPSERARAQEFAKDSGVVDPVSPVFRTVFEAWTAKAVGATSWAPSLAAWTAAIAAGVAEEALAAAARKAVEAGSKKALQYWLRDGDWRAFQKATPAGVASAWRGPPAILHELARRRGQDAAVTWLGRAIWDQARRAILCRTGLAADRLRAMLPKADWLALGVDVIEKGERA